MVHPAEIWERGIHELLAYDVAGYAELFAADAVVTWPFAQEGWPKRLEGREAIRRHVGAGLERSRAAGRTFKAVRDVVASAIGPREVVVEFALELATPEGEERLPYVHFLRLDADGFISELRDYFSGATGRNRTTARAFERLRHAVQSWSADAYADAFAEDGVVAYPFAPPGLDPETRGREAIRARTTAMIARADAAGRSVAAYRDVVVHPVSASLGVVEFVAERLTNGVASTMPYIWVIETRGEEIVRLRDYFDSAKALGLLRGA